MSCRGEIDHIRFGPTEDSWVEFEKERDQAVDHLVAQILKGVKTEMSWSVSFVGTPEGISHKLNEYAETLSGQSKEEFMDAKPHLQGLLGQVIKQNVRLNANGHATFTGDEKTYGSVSVVIENFYGDWCD